MTDGFVRAGKAGTLLTLRVSPGARRSSLEGTYGEHALKLKVAAPPVDGKANEEVRGFLAKSLGAPRTRVELVQGAAGRDETVLIRDAVPEDVLSALSSNTHG